MKTWLEATFDDIAIELAPGVTATRGDEINKLNWTSWLMHIGELINMDSNQFELTTREHFEDLTLLIHGEATRAMEGDYPTPEQSQAYMHSAEAKQVIDSLTSVAVGLTKETWPEFRDRVCKEVDLDPNDFRFDFEMS